MSYHGVGAGPGPVTTYKIDLPLPWGSNTSVTLPVQQMVDDAWTSLQPHIDAMESKLIQDGEDELNLYAPRAAKNVLDTVVRPYVDTELQTVFAQVDLVKESAIKAGLAITGTLVIAIGVAAWWVKKG